MNMISRTSLIVCLSLFFALATGSEAQSIHGRLSVDGEPLAGARVELRPILSAYDAAIAELLRERSPEIDGARSGADGGFALDAPSVSFHLDVFLRGVLAARRSTIGAESLNPAEIDFDPLRPLRIEVRGSDGEPLEGVRVVSKLGSFFDPEVELAPPPYPSYSPRRVQFTDARGIVRTARFDAEKLRVAAFHPDFAPAALSDVAEGAVLVLDAGAPRTIRVLLDETPVADAVISLDDLPVAVTDENGLCLVRLPREGVVQIRATTQDHDSVTQDVAASEIESEEALTLRLEPSLKIRGAVRAEASGEPVANAQVWIFRGDVVVADAGGFFSLSTRPKKMSPIMERHPLARQISVYAQAPGFFRRAIRVDPRIDIEHVVELQPAVVLPGQVVDQTGQPISGVSIQGSNVSSRSNPEGRFEIMISPNHENNLRFSHPDFMDQSLSTVYDPRSPETIFTLLRGARLSGTVLGPGDAPVAGAEIVVVELGDQHIRPHRRRGKERRFVAAGDGGFVVDGLPSGVWNLHVSAPNLAPGERLGVEVAQDEERMLDPIRLEEGARLTGRVVDSHGRPLSGIAVQLLDRKMLNYTLGSDLQAVEVTTDDDGRFVHENLKPGKTYAVQAKGETWAPTRSPPLVLPHPENIELILQPTAFIYGRVVDEEGRDLADAQVMFSTVSPFGGSSGRGGKIDEEGRFESHGLIPGKIHVVAEHPDYLSSEIVVDLSPGQIIDDLLLSLERGNELLVRTLDEGGVSVPNVRLSLYPESERHARRFLGFPQHTDEQGSFRFTGLPQGPARLQAFAEGFVAWEGDVVVATSSTHEITLERGAAVRGVVIGPDFLPVAGASVILRLPEEKHKTGGVRTLADGRFKMETVPDGTYEIFAEKKDLGRSTPEEIIVRGSVEGVNLRLEPGAVLRGTVSGFAPEDRTQIQVRTTERRRRPGLSLDFAGAYRFENMAPGEYVVEAVHPDERVVRGQVTIEVGQDEAVLDLEFAEGFALGGELLIDRVPRSMRMTAKHLESGASRQTFSDVDGRFHFENSPAGVYEVGFSDFTSGLMHQRRVELTGDLELDLNLWTASLEGSIFDAETGLPAADLRIDLAPVDPSRSEEEPGVPRRGSRLTQRTGADGAFRFPSLIAGTWRLFVEGGNYAPTQETLSIEPGEAEAVAVSLTRSSE